MHPTATGPRHAKRMRQPQRQRQEEEEVWVTLQTSRDCCWFPLRWFGGRMGSAVGFQRPSVRSPARVRPLESFAAGGITGCPPPFPLVCSALLASHLPSPRARPQREEAAPAHSPSRQEERRREEGRKQEATHANSSTAQHRPSTPLPSPRRIDQPKKLNQINYERDSSANNN